MMCDECKVIPFRWIAHREILIIGIRSWRFKRYCSRCYDERQALRARLGMEV